MACCRTAASRATGDGAALGSRLNAAQRLCTAVAHSCSWETDIRIRAAARPATETLSARIAALISKGGAVAAADLVKDKHRLTVSIVHGAS
jgi:hypothetical protein